MTAASAYFSRRRGKMGDEGGLRRWTVTLHTRDWGGLELQKGNPSSATELLLARKTPKGPCVLALAPLGKLRMGCLVVRDFLKNVLPYCFLDRRLLFCLGWRSAASASNRYSSPILIGACVVLAIPGHRGESRLGHVPGDGFPRTSTHTCSNSAWHEAGT